MKRNLFTLAVGFSVSICLLLIFIGIVSYWRNDLFGYETQKAGFYLACDRGNIELIWVKANPDELWRTDDDLFQTTNGWVYMPDCGGGGWAEWGFDIHKFLGQINVIRKINILGVHWFQYPVPFDFFDCHNITFFNIYKGYLYANLSAITFPILMPIVLFFLLPVLWLRKYRIKRQRIRRIAAGLCPECGYDLRASKIRCPECGTKIPDGLICPPLEPPGKVHD